MIGEFHMLGQAPGAHNPNFRPFRSQIPLLNIRPMVQEDLHFLSDRKYKPEDRIKLIKAYLAQKNFWTRHEQA